VIRDIRSRAATLNSRELPTPIQWGLSRQRRDYGKCRVHKLGNAPDPVRNPQRLRWCHLERFMYTAEIVMRDMQRDRTNLEPAQVSGMVETANLRTLGQIGLRISCNPLLFGGTKR
jgi:hypothetical protein